LLAIGFWPAAKRFFAEMKYKPKPRFRSGFMLADGLSTRKTLVGRMLLQPEVTLADGRTVLLDDCLGNGFALLGIGIAASDLRRVSSEPAIARLSLRSVVITDRTNSQQPVSGDKSVEIAFVARYPAEFEPYRDRILLVRPDRYVVTSGFVDGPKSIAVAANQLFSRWATTTAKDFSTA
jgi:3-(3-hydroxy-phenyl)propionate hydroxylase